MEMARARKVNLNLRILAKLMLLEYFQTEAFKQLAEIQAVQDGRPRVLEILDKERELASFKYDGTDHPEEKNRIADSKAPPVQTESENKNASSSKENISTEINPLDKDEETLIEAWRSDRWIKDWLSLEPALSGCDLRPYFYFSRDNLIFDARAVRRLNPAAQKVLAELLGESEVVRRKTLNDSIDLNLLEANSVLSSLAEHFRRQDKPDIREGILNLMLDLVDKRKDLITQIVLILKNIPENNIPLVTVPRLLTVSQGREEINAVYALFQGWSTNKLNSHLAEAARQRLKSRPTNN